MIHSFLPDMIERNEGHIVAIASITAYLSHSKCSLYTATKSAVSSKLQLFENMDHCDQPNLYMHFFGKSAQQL